MWEHTVLTAANSFFLPNHFSTRTVFLSGMEMSTAKCLKLLIKVPRGPLTVTTRDLTLASTSSGIVTDWLVLITFILKSKDKLKSKDWICGEKIGKWLGIWGIFVDFVEENKNSYVLGRYSWRKRKRQLTDDHNKTSSRCENKSAFTQPFKFLYRRKTNRRGFSAFAQIFENLKNWSRNSYFLRYDNLKRVIFLFLIWYILFNFS